MSEIVPIVGHVYGIPGDWESIRYVLRVGEGDGAYVSYQGLGINRSCKVAEWSAWLETGAVDITERLQGTQVPAQGETPYFPEYGELAIASVVCTLQNLKSKGAVEGNGPTLRPDVKETVQRLMDEGWNPPPPVVSAVMDALVDDGSVKLSPNHATVETTP